MKYTTLTQSMQQSLADALANSPKINFKTQPSTDELKNQCDVYRVENQALKALVDELSRKLYEVAPQSTITFNAKDLALSNLLLIPVDL